MSQQSLCFREKNHVLSSKLSRNYCQFVETKNPEQSYQHQISSAEVRKLLFLLNKFDKIRFAHKYIHCITRRQKVVKVFLRLFHASQMTQIEIIMIHILPTKSSLEKNFEQKNSH